MDPFVWAPPCSRVQFGLAFVFEVQMVMLIRNLGLTDRLKFRVGQLLNKKRFPDWDVGEEPLPRTPRIGADPNDLAFVDNATTGAMLWLPPSIREAV